MKKHKYTTDQLHTIKHIFENHINNAEGLVKDIFGLSGEDFKQMKTNFFEGEYRLRKPSRSYRLVKKHIEKIEKIGGVVDREELTAQLPRSQKTLDVAESVSALSNYGYNVSFLLF